MCEMQREEENISYPSVVFQIKSAYYAVSSEYVAAIMQIPQYEILPDAPKSLVGLVNFREKVIPIISVRVLFGMPTLREESAAFTAMLEQRKQDHIHWVQELNRSVQDNVPFTLAKDPHKCEFGRWFDHYEPDNHTIRFHLNKIEEPHRLLHETAAALEKFQKDPDQEQRQKKMKAAVLQAEELYMPKILDLLEEAKELFDAVNHSILIVIEHPLNTFAIAVDSVISVEELADAEGKTDLQMLRGSQYLSKIKKSTKLTRLILLLDDGRVAEIASPRIPENLHSSPDGQNHSIA